MTSSERKAHFDRLSSIGCIVCRQIHGVITPASIHHLTGLKYRSTGKKAKDEHVIPLCHAHHQGHLGIHTLGTRTWEREFGTQEAYLAIVEDMVARQH